MPHERVLARDFAMPDDRRLHPLGRLAGAPGRPGRPGRGLGLDHALPLARGNRPRRHGASAGPAARCATTRRRCSRRCSPSSRRTASPWSTTRPRCWLARGEMFRDLADRLARPRGRPHHRRLDAARRGRQALAPAAAGDADAAVHPRGQRRARSRGGLLPVNSFWVSGTGALPGSPPQPAAPGLQITHYLRDAALVEDWRGLGRRLAAARCRANARGCPKRSTRARPCRLTLCGERNAQTWSSGDTGIFAPHGQPVRPPERIGRCFRAL